jgi:hypothetical protein
MLSYQSSWPDLLVARALSFQDAIDDYTAHDRNGLRDYRLNADDWAALRVVERWLRYFRAATHQMSSSKRPTLSSVHAVFRGLQAHLRTCLVELSDDCPTRLKEALVAAHQKLSDYYWRFDEESPFYLWAASTYLILLIHSY